jgi:RNA polymerase primary sigma factor
MSRELKAVASATRRCDNRWQLATLGRVVRLQPQHLRRHAPPAERLTPRQEQDLVIATESGDADACRRLVAAFMPSIVGLATHFPRGIGVELQELVQDGVAGLLLATRRYDPSLNTPFWAYASFWVRKAMQELIAELGRPVSLSDRAVRDLARVRKARNEHLLAHGSEPRDAELSRATGFSRKQLESLRAAERTPRGMEERLHTNEQAAATVGDTVVDPIAERAYEEVLDEIEIHEVQHLADKLDERERSVLAAHYGLGQPAHTLDQIGCELGLTAERARQIELVALNKLREGLTQPHRPVAGQPSGTEGYGAHAASPSSFSYITQPSSGVIPARS